MKFICITLSFLFCLMSCISTVDSIDNTMSSEESSSQDNSSDVSSSVESSEHESSSVESSSENESSSSEINDSSSSSTPTYDGTEIMLVYRVLGQSTHPDTLYMNQEGDTSIVFSEDEDEYPSGSQLAVRIFAMGFYTEILDVKEGESFTVDLEPTPVPRGEADYSGVIIGYQYYSNDCYVKEKDLVVNYSDGTTGAAKTDTLGRFLLEGQEPITSITFSYDDIQFAIIFDEKTHVDFIFEEPMLLEAPYIYVYPEETTKVSVTLDLLSPGSIIASIPEYTEGWNVIAEPNGLIDSEYPFLFYETKQITNLEVSTGWVLQGETIEEELDSILIQLGLVENEREDFFKFWSPLLPDAPYYIVHPQNIDALVALTVQPNPENVIRVLLFVTPSDIALNIPEPLVREEPPQRDGYTVVEWGVIFNYSY